MLEALYDWNVWWSDRDSIEHLTGKPRSGVDIEKLLKFKEIKVVTGIRRSGKSTLFYQIIKHLLNIGTKPRQILLVNFEDELLSGKTLKDIFSVYMSNVGSEDTFLFLDEVHKAGDWIQFLRKLYDTKQLRQVFITDSSSQFISKEYSGVLTGRNVKLIFYPLSFPEYVNWRGLDIKSLGLKMNHLNKALNEYFMYGGFPEVFFKEPVLKRILLKDYFNDILYHDVIDRFGVDIHKAKELALFLLSNMALPFSVRKYSRQHGLSLESIEKYSSFFEEVFLIFKLRRFDYSFKAQQVSPKKIYVIDQGLTNVIGFRMSENRGRLLENLVFLHLLRNSQDLFYWKNKNEVDFIVRVGTRITQLIQVCSHVDENNRKREIAGILEATEQFKLKEGTIVTENTEKTETVDGIKIKLVPFIKWIQ